MSDYVKFAKKVQAALNNEKPHSSITDWIERLTANNIELESYDGIPEIVESVNLQPTSGAAEASRAIRKKLKHAGPHQQYRAIVILKALVDNGGHRFQTTFADGQLTDAIKNLATDPTTDAQVKKKILAVLASWHNQFKDDPSMRLVVNLYRQCKPAERRSLPVGDLSQYPVDDEWEKKRAEKEEAKKKAKAEKEEAKERQRRVEEAARQRREREKQAAKNRGKKRPPFDFAREKPQVLESIANASQASSNLVNAITLVNPQTDSIKTNARVQECLEKAKLIRRQVVRYIQLVENEEIIGTLIETNERIMTALEMYDKMSAPEPATEEDITKGLAAANIAATPGEVNKLQSKQREAVERAAKGNETTRGKGRASYTHPDLQDLDFDVLGDEHSGNLPPPLEPRRDSDSEEHRGSLSDYSDYESSDEESHNRESISTRNRRPYIDVSDESGDERYPIAGSSHHAQLVDAEDPFADPS